MDRPDQKTDVSRMDCIHSIPPLRSSGEENPPSKQNVEVDLVTPYIEYTNTQGLGIYFEPTTIKK